MDKQIYKCEVCGNVAQLLHSGNGILYCCNEKMMKLTEKSDCNGAEKHVPIIEQIDSGFSVTVGSTIHPMVEEHYIEWIELIVDGLYYRKYLKPGDEPKATFFFDGKVSNIKTYSYCNIHELWRN